MWPFKEKTEEKTAPTQWAIVTWDTRVTVKDKSGEKEYTISYVPTLINVFDTVQEARKAYDATMRVGVLVPILLTEEEDTAGISAKVVIPKPE